jgi:outer membrane protein OmpU
MAGSSASNNKSINYTFPSMVDDLALTASYSGSTTAIKSTTAWAATYTGVEGLSLSYGSGENGSTVAGAVVDLPNMNGCYTMG